MDDSHLIVHIKPNTDHVIAREARVSDFITTSKQWSINTLNNILPKVIINKIKILSITSQTLEILRLEIYYKR